MANLKQVKKRWFQIQAPKTFNATFLGDTFLATPEEGIGKKLIISLAQLTNDSQKQNINIEFEIVKTEKDILRTRIVNYFIMPAALRKVARKGKDKLENSFSAKNKDDQELRIKTVFVPRKKIKGGISSNLQNTSKELIRERLKTMTYEELITDLITRKFQSILSKDLKKIYPLSFCEIRWAELVDKSKTPATEPEQTATPAPESITPAVA